MMTRNLEGLNLIEQCCFILFEDRDERFLIHVLSEVPRILKYLYITNSQGWLPLFRILHIFQDKFYESEENAKTIDIAKRILTLLGDINYDFLHPSKVDMNDIANINTYEMILYQIPEPSLFKHISLHLKRHDHNRFIEIVR